MSRLSVVIVTWNEADSIVRCLPPLVAQLGEGDELIVSDNGSTDGTLDVVSALAPGAVVLPNARNIGFAAACNSGAAVASGDLLVLLNADTVVAPGWAGAIRRPLEKDYGWTAWQALVTMDGGRAINTDGGIVHFTGIAWAGNAGEPVDHAPAEPREVGFASGACLAIELAAWRRHGGFAASYNAYHEDVDLALRLRLAGERVGIEPAARVEHDYEFSRRGAKWRMLERNRWATLIRTYPGALLALLAPALLVAEVATLVAALGQRWAKQKLLAQVDVIRALPTLLRERQVIQASRVMRPAQFACGLVPDLSSSYLGPVARSRAARITLRVYWRAVLRTLDLRR